MNRKYRKAIIAGNWKMNMLLSDVKPFVDELKPLLPKNKQCDTVLCVPALYVQALRKACRDAKILTGTQDVSVHDSGAYTGEISAAQLENAGVRYCIVGHSERRAYHGEDDMLVNAKARALLAKDIIPIICVGETLEQRERGLTSALTNLQVRGALSGMEPAEIRRCVIAYEPIWAIGTGVTATAEQAEEVCREIRSVIRDMSNARVARGICILYGGSMKASNARELLAQPDIDGGLIGGASLKPAEFAKIIAATGDAAEDE